jgi:peptide deformylase
MIRRVLQYGDPVLRQKGALIEAIAPAIERLIQDLLDTMYAEKGIGLAAQQVGEPLQLTVLDIRSINDQRSRLRLNDNSVDPEAWMPLVLINPDVTPVGDPVAGHEGCLSFPDISAEIRRPETVQVAALDRAGQPIKFSCEGLLARVIQHEVDHLNGILFIDRMDMQTKADLRRVLSVLHARTKEILLSSSERRGGMPRQGKLAEQC